MTKVQKRRGQIEEYDQGKVFASVYAACLACHLDKKRSEEIAKEVTTLVTDWLKDKNQIDRNRLFTKVHRELEYLHSGAAFLYRTHRDVS